MINCLQIMLETYARRWYKMECGCPLNTIPSMVCSSLTQDGMWLSFLRIREDHCFLHRFSQRSFRNMVHIISVPGYSTLITVLLSSYRILEIKCWRVGIFSASVLRQPRRIYDCKYGKQFSWSLVRQERRFSTIPNLLLMFLKVSPNSTTSQYYCPLCPFHPSQQEIDKYW